MLSGANPISSASAAPASVTAAAVSPALGTGRRLGEEGQGQREDLAGSLGLQVVVGTVDDGQFTEAGEQAEMIVPAEAGVTAAAEVGLVSCAITQSVCRGARSTVGMSE
jgi:hypothetical protein